MQIQSIMRYHFSPTRMAKIRETGKSRCWGGCEEVGILIYCWWEYEMMYLLYKTAWQFLKVLNTELLCDPAIILINTYARKLENMPRETSVWTLSVLFIRAKKKMETTKCPSADGWIQKYGISYNETISIIRKYWYILQHGWTFEIIMLSERVQSEKDTEYSVYIKFPEETNT